MANVPRQAFVLSLLSLLILLLATELPANLEKFDQPLRQILQADSVSSDLTGVIVQTVTPPTPEDEARVRELGGTVVRRYTLIPALAARVPANRLRDLAAWPRVKRLSSDLKVQPKMEYAGPAVGAPEVTGLMGLTGAGVGIAVIDSGITLHPDLCAPEVADLVQAHLEELAPILALLDSDDPGQQAQGFARLVRLLRRWGYRGSIQAWLDAARHYLAGRVVAGYDFVNDKRRRLGNDACGHGSNVAGIIAGNGLASNLYLSENCHTTRHFPGIAPGANLINLRVLDETGTGYVSDAIAAVEWAVTHAAEYNLRVINLSVGHPIGEPFSTDPLCLACAAAWERGLVVVVAAGNWGRDGYFTVDSPGNHPWVLSVGAINTMKTVTRADDVMCTYSAKGPTILDHVLKPDLVAPGNRIISLRHPGSYLERMYGDLNMVPVDYYWLNPPSFVQSRYFQMSGTSMATAVVSGAVALLLEADPGLSPDTVKARLMASANKNVYNPDGTLADIFTRGAGYLDIPGALAETKVVDVGHAGSPWIERGPEEGLFYLYASEDPPMGTPPPDPPPSGDPPPGTPPPEDPPPGTPPPTNVLWGEGGTIWACDEVYGDGETVPWGTGMESGTGSDTGSGATSPPPAPGDPTPTPQPTPPPANVLWGENVLWADVASWTDDTVWSATYVWADVDGLGVIGEAQRGVSGQYDDDGDPTGRYEDAE